jgi:hypothetical protein
MIARSVLRAVVPTLVALALAGCSGRHAAVAPATTTTATGPAIPTLTSGSDRLSCAELETKIRLVSQLVSGSVELMTQSLRPKELARRTGDAQRNVLYAASVLELMRVPSPLATARRRLVLGLRSFAADFGRAKASVARGDIAAAARQLDDRTALAQVAAATSRIDRACRT